MYLVDPLLFPCSLSISTCPLCSMNHTTWSTVTVAIHQVRVPIQIFKLSMAHLRLPAAKAGDCPPPPSLFALKRVRQPLHSAGGEIAHKHMFSVIAFAPILHWSLLVSMTYFIATLNNHCANTNHSPLFVQRVQLVLFQPYRGRSPLLSTNFHNTID